jgi:hypothetical protein
LAIVNTATTRSSFTSPLYFHFSIPHPIFDHTLWLMMLSTARSTASMALRGTIDLSLVIPLLLTLE